MPALQFKAHGARPDRIPAPVSPPKASVGSVIQTKYESVAQASGFLVPEIANWLAVVSDVSSIDSLAFPE